MASVELVLVGFVEAAEFGLHVLHVGVFRNVAGVVGFHEEEKLSNVVLAEGEAVLGAGDRGFLGAGGIEEGENKNGQDDGNLEIVFAEHGRLLEWNEENVLRGNARGVTQRTDGVDLVFGGGGTGEGMGIENREEKVENRGNEDWSGER